MRQRFFSPCRLSQNSQRKFWTTHTFTAGAHLFAAAACLQVTSESTETLGTILAPIKGLLQGLLLFSLKNPNQQNWRACLLSLRFLKRECLWRVTAVLKSSLLRLPTEMGWLRVAFWKLRLVGSLTFSSRVCSNFSPLLCDSLIINYHKRTVLMESNISPFCLVWILIYYFFLCPPSSERVPALSQLIVFSLSPRSMLFVAFHGLSVLMTLKAVVPRRTERGQLRIAFNCNPAAHAPYIQAHTDCMLPTVPYPYTLSSHSHKWSSKALLRKITTSVITQSSLNSFSCVCFSQTPFISEWNSMGTNDLFLSCWFIYPLTLCITFKYLQCQECFGSARFSAAFICFWLHLV